MQFQHPLDRVLNSEYKVRILRFLSRKGGEWIGRRLAAELSMNPVTAHRALRELHQATILDFRKVGSHFLYSLRDDHCLVREVLRPLFEREARTRGRLLNVLKRAFRAKVRSSVVAAAVYGSLARGEERPASDIDLLVVGNHQTLELQKKLSEIQKSMGREINMVQMSPREYEKKQKSDPFLKSVNRGEKIQIL